MHVPRDSGSMGIGLEYLQLQVGLPIQPTLSYQKGKTADVL